MNAHIQTHTSNLFSLSPSSWLPSSVSVLLWLRDGGSGSVVMGDGSLHLPPLSLAHLHHALSEGPRHPPPSRTPFTILTTPAPCSIHKAEMISVLPLCVGRDKTMPHSTTEHHPSRRSSIWHTKDEMWLELPSLLCSEEARPPPLSLLFTARLVVHQRILLPCVAYMEGGGSN